MMRRTFSFGEAAWAEGTQRETVKTVKDAKTSRDTQIKLDVNEKRREVALRIGRIG